MSESLETLLVGASESLASIENLLCDVALNKNYKIRLPSKLNTRGALGVESLVTQLIGTWLDNSESKVFHSYQGGSSESFIDLCSSIYGLSILTMANEIWDAEKKPLTRKNVLIGAVETIDNIRNKNFSGAFKSRYFGIPCIKKPTYDREFLMPVYNGSEVIESDAFLKLIKSILVDTISGSNRFKTLDQFIGIEDLSDLLWELFNNTHDHGRTDDSGNELSKNFRSLIIQQQDVTQDYFKSWLGENPSDAQIGFYESQNNKSKNIPILDISVVDFGKGFVDMAREKSDLESESEILLKCFETGWSRLPKKNRGVGLTKILTNILKYRGWLRIRSGNLLIEKSYSSEEDFRIKKEDIKQMKCKAVGTTVHISIPLNKRMD